MVGSGVNHADSSNMYVEYFVCGDVQVKLFCLGVYVEVVYFGERVVHSRPMDYK